MNGLQETSKYVLSEFHVHIIENSECMKLYENVKKNDIAATNLITGWVTDAITALPESKVQKELKDQLSNAIQWMKMELQGKNHDKTYEDISSTQKECSTWKQVWTNIQETMTVLVQGKNNDVNETMEELLYGFQKLIQISKTEIDLKQYYTAYSLLMRVIAYMQMQEKDDDDVVLQCNLLALSLVFSSPLDTKEHQSMWYTVSENMSDNDSDNEEDNNENTFLFQSTSVQQIMAFVQRSSQHAIEMFLILRKNAEMFTSVEKEFPLLRTTRVQLYKKLCVCITGNTMPAPRTFLQWMMVANCMKEEHPSMMMILPSRIPPALSTLLSCLDPSLVQLTRSQMDVLRTSTIPSSYLNVSTTSLESLLDLLDAPEASIGVTEEKNMPLFFSDTAGDENRKDTTVEVQVEEEEEEGITASSGEESSDDEKEINLRPTRKQRVQ